jgi:capsular polysaccharide transport system permease protein
MSYITNSSSGSAWRGLATQARVIWALLVRELVVRYGYDNLGVFWVMLEPALLAAGVSTVHFFANFQPPPGCELIPWFTIGYSLYQVFRSGANRSAAGMGANVFLLHHRTISVTDFWFSRGLIETLGPFLACLVIQGLVALIGYGRLPDRPLLFVVTWLLDFWYVWSLSMILFSIYVVWKPLPFLVHPATYLMLPVSGVFLPLSAMPPAVAYYVSFVPLAQITEVGRESFFSAFHSPWFDPSYVVKVCIVQTILGLLAIRATRPKADID